MGEILLKVIDGTPRHKNTVQEYSKEIAEDRYRYVLDKISQNIPSGKVCYVFGMGKHPKSTYVALKSSHGIEVVWYGSLLPNYFGPLRLLVASYEGIVKIFDPNKVKGVFETLSKMAMVGVYIFDANMENAFIETVKSKKYSQYADEVIKEDKGYFIYKIDADSVESSTGIFEIVSYGIDCSKEITGILNLG
jgi:hypothetical protein